MLVPPGGQLIGVIGFLEALDAANRILTAHGKPALYELQLTGVDADTKSVAGPVLTVAPSSSIEAAHTLVVGGTLDIAEHPVDARLLAEARRLAALAERLVSVCMGAFVLGELGLLDGRRCTSHWLGLDQLRGRFPAARVEPDAIFTEDESLFTSAGATAGIDLALHLIRRDGGRRLSLAVAKALVVFVQRPGGQSQFGSALRLRPGMDDRLRELVGVVLQDPSADHRVERLAKAVGMSPRHFARVFREQTGETPAAFVARARVEAAQRALEDSDAAVSAVAEDCGFGSEAVLRRTFLRIVGVTPTAYRERFTLQC